MNYCIYSTLQIDTILEMCGFDQMNSMSWKMLPLQKKSDIFLKNRVIIHNLLPFIVWLCLTGLANFSDTLSNHYILWFDKELHVYE